MMLLALVMWVVMVCVAVVVSVVVMLVLLVVWCGVGDGVVVGCVAGSVFVVVVADVGYGVSVGGVRGGACVDGVGIGTVIVAGVAGGGCIDGGDDRGVGVAGVVGCGCSGWWCHGDGVLCGDGVVDAYMCSVVVVNVCVGDVVRVASRVRYHVVDDGCKRNQYRQHQYNTRATNTNISIRISNITATTPV